MGMIYKYRKCDEHTQLIFKTGCLHYAYPSEFNDPFDCLLSCVDKTFIFFLRDSENKTFPVLVSSKELEQDLQDSISKIQICCFSLDGLQMQMWSHYADYHKGICLEFDYDLLFDRQMVDARYVNYLPEQVILDENFLGQITEKHLSFLYTKHSSWAYEKEVRFFYRPSEKQNHPFNKSALKSIYFGAKCSSSDITIYKKLCIENGFEHVQFFQVVLSEDKKYGLKLQEINV